MDNTEHLHALTLDSSMELHLENESVVETQGLDYEVMKSMIEIYEITREIKASTKEHFTLELNRKNHKIIRCDSLGKNILSMIDNITNIILAMSETHDIDPNVKLFIDAAKAANIVGCGYIANNLIDDYANKIFDRLTGFVKHIRDYDDTELKKQESNAYRASQKNHISVIEYLNKLFSIHSRILVVRVDLAYGAKHTASTSIDDVKKHRDNLFRRMHKMKNFDAWIGHVWKLEYGLKKGYHYHMLFMFDGSKVRQDITIGLNIGQLWSEKITDSKGVYFNCNAYKYKYKYCGLGMVNYYEKEKIEGIHKAISYFIKIDRFIKLRSKQIGRTLGKGEIRKSKNNAGRPRSKSRAC